MNSENSKFFPDAISGTEAVVACLGEHYGRTRYSVWKSKVEKKGATVPINGDMRRGLHLEPLVRDMYRDQHPEYSVTDEQIIRHPSEPLAGHADGLINEDGVLEIKCPRSGRARKIVETSDLPEAWHIQVMHYMRITKRKWADVVVFDGDNWESVVAHVEYDPVLGDVIAESCLRLWDCVLTETPPDGFGIVAPKGRNVEIEVIDNPVLIEAVQNYRSAAEAIKQLEELQSTARLGVLAVMDARVLAKLPDNTRIAAGWSEGRKTIDGKAILADHPEIDAAKYTKIGEPIRMVRITGGNK
jgi:predicted phage-related endonuclease